MSESIEQNKSNVDSSATSVSSNPRKLRSEVWNDFKKVTQKDGRILAVCNHCRKSLSGNSKSGTTHLKNHLDYCSSYQRVKRKKLDVGQQLIKIGEKKIDGTSNIECHEFDQQRSRDDLTRAMIFHEYPFSMVDHYLFRKFISNLQPKFKMMTRNTSKSDCLKMYNTQKEKLYKLLDELPCKVSLTSDMWTLGVMEGYLCLTCHYIDDNWKFQKKILNFFNVEAPHTGEEISKVIVEKLYDWNIDGKIFSIVLDNCTTNDVVIRELLKILQPKKSLLMDGSLFHVRCCAHILNLVVQDGLEPIRQVIKNVRETVKYIKSSQVRLEKFKKIVYQVRAPRKALFYDVSTRWNSTYLMLENSIKFQGAFARLAECDSKYMYAPSSQDWENVKVIMDCLKIFLEVTEKISDTKYPTSNLYFNDLCDIYLCLKNWFTKSPHPFVVSVARCMLEKFEKYWRITNVVFAISSILDPGFKLKSVEYFFDLIYKDAFDASEKVDNVRNCMVRLYDEYVLHSSQVSRTQELSCNVESSNGGSSRVCESFSHSMPTSTRWGLARFIQETSSSQPKKSELDIYLEEPLRPGVNDDKFDVLGWWKIHAPKYPIVSLMARDILGIPVSTVASESAFSTGGRVLDEYRGSLNPSTAEALICTQDWLRAQVKDISHDGSSNEFSTISNAVEVDGDFDVHTVPFIGDDFHSMSELEHEDLLIL